MNPTLLVIAMAAAISGAAIAQAKTPAYADFPVTVKGYTSNRTIQFLMAGKGRVIYCILRLSHWPKKAMVSPTANDGLFCR